RSAVLACHKCARDNAGRIADRTALEPSILPEETTRSAGGIATSSLRLPAHHTLDLVYGESLGPDRQLRRAFGEVERVDNSLAFGRYRRRLAACILGGDRNSVVAVGPLHSACVAPVPDKILRSGIHRHAAGIACL